MFSFKTFLVCDLFGGAQTQSVVTTDRLSHAILKRFAHQRVADGNFGNALAGYKQFLQICKTEIVPGVHAKSDLPSSASRQGIPLEHRADRGCAARRCIRFGVEFNAVGAEILSKHDLFGIRIHEKTDATAEVLSFGNQWTQFFTLFDEIEAVITRFCDSLSGTNVT